MMKSKRYRNRMFGIVTTLVLGSFFLVSVILPLISVMTNLKNADLRAIFSHPQTMPAILNSLKVTPVATVFPTWISAAAPPRRCCPGWWTRACVQM